MQESELEREDFISSDVHYGAQYSNEILSEKNLSISRYCLYIPLTPNSHGTENSSPSLRRRKKTKSDNCLHLTIYHQTETSLSCVGKQLWRGSFLLSDYLLSRREHFQNNIAFELGSGVGFLSKICSLLSFQEVYTTDYEQDIVGLAKRNIDTNSHLTSLSGSDKKVPIHPRILNWFDPAVDRKTLNTLDGWSIDDVLSLSTSEVVWLAADVIYDDNITKAFFRTLGKLMKPTERLFLSLEKRFNFTIEELSVVAHGYYQFLKYVQESQKCYLHENDSTSFVQFIGRRVPLLFPQFIEYDRVKDLELWEIVLSPIDCK